MTILVVCFAAIDVFPGVACGDFGECFFVEAWKVNSEELVGGRAVGVLSFRECVFAGASNDCAEYSYLWHDIWYVGWEVVIHR